jgi:para-nitrobenzyl esterase
MAAFRQGLVPFVPLVLLALVACACDDTPATGPDGGGDGDSDAATSGPDASASCAPAPWGGGDLAVTDEGPVRGSAAGTTIAWKGIAFAQPPLADLRFRAPVPLGCTSEERAADAFGAACVQMDGDTVIGDEDCLTLNVWTPTAAAAAPRPVLVFMHGGGNVQGSASLAFDGATIYDGADLAALGDVVVVTIQYRLGPFGFLAHPALTAEAGASGNYGLRDQLLALRWIQRNAAAFGGDPARVLLFGESAGAVDTCAQLSSPLAAGLFSAALMESGGCGAKPLADEEAYGEEVATSAGCASDAAACLRAVDPSMLVELAGGEPVGGGLVRPKFGPVVDGDVLPVAPLAALRAGTHNHVPFIVGANADETSSLGVPPTMTEAQYEAAVRDILGNTIGDQVLALYPAADYASPRQAFIQVTSDAQFVCPARTIARAADGGQDEPVYRYFFTHRLSGALGAFRGAAHGLELFFVFQKHDEASSYVATADDAAVAATMGGAWTRFAATGDPNGGGAPVWPTYDVATDPYLELAPSPLAGTGVHTAKCDFWDSITP